MNSLVAVLQKHRSTLKELRKAAAQRTATSSRLVYSEERMIDVLLRVGLALMTAATLLSVTLLAAVHVTDRYQVNHVSGTWMALARDLNEGVLYRPFFEGGYYGLSGYMPLQFVVNAGASRVTGEYLVSAKLVAYASGLALLILVFALLRRAGCPRLLSFGLVAALLATHTGLLAVTGIHGDTLPLLLQLAALSLILRSTSRQAVAGAAALCVLAVLIKFTAIWAPLTIVIWLAVKERRRLAPFLGTLVGGTIALLAFFEITSDGRLSENVAEVFVPSGSAFEGSFTAGVSTFFELMVERAGAIWLLLPFAALTLLLGIARRSLTLVELALVIAVGVVVVVLGNPGSDFNHLVDVGVLTVLVVGEQWARAARSTDHPSVLPALICIAVILGTAQSYRVTMKSDVAHAVKVFVGSEPSAYSTRALEGVVGDDDLLLSEDPVVPILRGERPILLDGLGLRRLAKRHSGLIASLEQRLNRKNFARIVLIHPIEDRDWYREMSLGATIRDAIDRNYSFLARVQASLNEYYWVYAPKSSRSYGSIR